MTVQELAATLATLDPSMQVRIVGNGPILSTHLAVSREARGENLLLLLAVEVAE